MELAPYHGSGDDDQDPSKVKVLITTGGGDGSGSQELSLKVERSILIGKIKKVYCNRYGVSVNALKFLHEGNRLNEKYDFKTLQELGDDEDGTYYFDVFQNQDGGGLPFDRSFWF